MMTELRENEIEIIIILDSDGSDHSNKALLDNTVHENWISASSVSHLKLTPSSGNFIEEWNRRELQSTEAVTLSWRRANVDIPEIYRHIFHVTSDDSFSMLIGRDALSKRASIKNPKKGVYVGEKTKNTQGIYTRLVPV